VEVRASTIKVTRRVLQLHLLWRISRAHAVDAASGQIKEVTLVLTRDIITSIISRFLTYLQSLKFRRWVLQSVVLINISSNFLP
jgi:hypothetical protein